MLMGWVDVRYCFAMAILVLILILILIYMLSTSPVITFYKDSEFVIITECFSIFTHYHLIVKDNDGKIDQTYIYISIVSTKKVF